MTREMQEERNLLMIKDFLKLTRNGVKKSDAIKKVSELYDISVRTTRKIMSQNPKCNYGSQTRAVNDQLILAFYNNIDRTGVSKNDLYAFMAKEYRCSYSHIAKVCQGATDAALFYTGNQTKGEKKEENKIFNKILKLLKTGVVYNSAVMSLCKDGIQSFEHYDAIIKRTAIRRGVNLEKLKGEAKKINNELTKWNTVHDNISKEKEDADAVELFRRLHESGFLKTIPRTKREKLKTLKCIKEIRIAQLTSKL